MSQLRHRRATLPELAKIGAALERADGVRNQQLDVRTALDDTAGEQRRLENEVDTVRTRAERDNKRLSGGGLPAKELESLQHEITSLARRQGALEDELLEVMEQRETREGELAALDAELAGIEAELAELEAKRDADVRRDRRGDRPAHRRADRAGGRAAGRPAGAVREGRGVDAAGSARLQLKQRRCEGCHLELAGSELNVFRAAPPDAVLRCENCRRILIRTAESGL